VRLKPRPEEPKTAPRFLPRGLGDKTETTIMPPPFLIAILRVNR